MKLSSTVVLLFSMLFSVECFSETKSIRIIERPNNGDPNSQYVISVIRLALDHIDNKYKLEIISNDATQARVDEEVRTHGSVDMMWTPGNAQKESDFRAIPIPLDKGLLGFRLLIIKKGDQAKFDHVKTLDDLKKFKFGQGRTWADSKILEANGLNVVKTTKYPGLFYMLDGGRFDAFPRGANEPFVEIEKHPDLNLEVEKNLLIVYKMPFYLFVAKDNTQLAHDIELGLNRALADGSFDKVFYSAKTVQDVIQKANLRERRVIYLDNPTLSKETPLDRKELWIDPQAL